MQGAVRVAWDAGSGSATQGLATQRLRTRSSVADAASDDMTGYEQRKRRFVEFVEFVDSCRARQEWQVDRRRLLEREQRRGHGFFQRRRESSPFGVLLRCGRTLGQRRDLRMACRPTAPRRAHEEAPRGAFAHNRSDPDVDAAVASRPLSQKSAWAVRPIRGRASLLDSRTVSGGQALSARRPRRSRRRRRGWRRRGGGRQETWVPRSSGSSLQCDSEVVKFWNGRGRESRVTPVLTRHDLRGIDREHPQELLRFGRVGPRRNLLHRRPGCISATRR